jgi:hypothetical protein
MNMIGKRMKGFVFIGVAAGAWMSVGFGGGAVAADKGIRFWNLTSATIAKLYISPAGKDAYGPNQCDNDKDGTVDHDERLKITNYDGGKADVKVAYENGRVCIVKGIDIAPGKVFSIEDKDLTSCNK